MYRISDNRFGGIAGRIFNTFRKLCGESVLQNTVLVTNMWKEDSQDIGEAREKELSDNFFKPALDKGAQMVRHHNTTESAQNILRMIIRNHPVALQIQRELVDEGKDIIDTAAGESLNVELKALISKHQVELEYLRGDMMQALKEKDEEARRELEKAKGDLEEVLGKIKEDTEKMVASYAAEKQRMEAEMIEMERAEAEHDRNLDKDQITIPIFK